MKLEEQCRTLSTCYWRIPFIFTKTNPDWLLMAVPSPADCDGSHFVILLEEILIHSAVFWNTTMDQDMFELFPKVNFDQNLQRNLVKKEMKIATSHQKLHAGTYYIHMYIVRKYLNKKMALFKICQCHTLLEWKCQSSMSSDQGIH